MPEKEVEVNPVTRVEGESKLILNVDDEGIVREGYYLPFLPVRGFEKMLQGKSFRFLPGAVMRICGVCHITHAIAAAEAVESVFGVKPPQDGLLLRELAGLINRLESQALHVLFLLEDLFRGEKRGEMTKKTFQLIGASGKMMTVIGGSPVHPQGVVVGGMEKNLSEKGAEEIRNNLKVYREGMEELLEEVKVAQRRLAEEGILKEDAGEVRVRRLATHPTYGNSLELDLLELTLVDPHSYYDHESAAKEARSLLALYGGEVTEVGPGARMRLYDSFKEEGPLSVNLAYMMEALRDCERAGEILETLNLKGRTYERVTPKGGKGVGVHEAPRGTNIHIAHLREDGTILDYRIIVPTMFNIPVINVALKGVPEEYAPLVVRSYDPCLSCASHVIRVEEVVD